MKRILAIIITLAASGLALPSQAQAGSIRVGHTVISTSGYHSCGCAIQNRRVFVGYDRYQRPIFRYYRVQTNHRCGARHLRSNHGRRDVYHSGRGNRRSASYYRRTRNRGYRCR